MKKILIPLLLTAMSFGMGSCCLKEDINEIRNELQNHDGRLTSLEEWQESVNTSIKSLQDLIKALEDKDYVTEVTPLEDGTGYVISFLKSGNVTIKHGEKGEKGDTPVISAKQDTDGKYYWTVNGEWLLVNDLKMPVTGEKGDDGETPYIGENGNWWIGTTDTGKKAQGDTGNAGQTPYIGENGNWWIDTEDTGVKAQGDKGEQGAAGVAAVAPQVRINPDTNEWEISTDSGKSWTSTGVKATGEQGEKGEQGEQGPTGPSGAACGISDITIDGNSVTFTLGSGQDAQEIVVPLCSTKLTFNDLDEITEENNTFSAESELFSMEDVVIQVRVESKSADGTDIITRSASDRWNISTAISGNVMEITVNPAKETALNETALLKVNVTSEDGEPLASGQKVFTNGIFSGVLSVSSIDDLMAQLEKIDKSKATDIRIEGSLEEEADRTDIYNLTYALKGFSQIGTLEISVPEINSLITDAFSDTENMKVFKSDYIRNLAPDGCTFWYSTVEEVYLPEVETLYQFDFSNCENLRKVDLENVTEVQGSQVFFSCRSLETLDLPNLTTFGLLSYSNFARDCSLLKKVNMPKVTSLPNSGFMDCSSLESLSFPAVTQLGSSVFTNCIRLSSISLPEVAVLPDNTFKGCTSLNAESGFDNVTEVGHSAFSGCSAITWAALWKVTKIGPSAFAGCSSLNELSLGAVSSVDSSAFDGVDTESCTVTFRGTPTDGSLDRSNKMWAGKKWKMININ